MIENSLSVEIDDSKKELSLELATTWNLRMKLLQRKQSWEKKWQVGSGVEGDERA